jgi:cytochrome oxidase Cu insertion factor (SCO1/SenC/PrrC family)
LNVPIDTRRSRRHLLVIALVFFLPLALSFYLYYGTTLHPVARVNKGELIQPPRPLPDLTLPLLAGGRTPPKFLQGKWTFLYVQAGACTEICLKRLYDMRQIRLLLDRDKPRVQRVFLGDERCCDLPALRESHPDLIAARRESAAPLTALLPDADAGAGRLYLVDPLGNAMMWYAAGADPKDLLRDMKRLLQLSQIG